MTTPEAPRPPFPPFDLATAQKKARLAEDAWNNRDADKVSMAYTPDSIWRNRAEFLNGRAEIVMNDDLLLNNAKTKALWLSQGRYVAKAPRKDILVSGSDGYSNLDLGIYLYEQSKMISAYDAHIARAIARILTGDRKSVV